MSAPATVLLYHRDPFLHGFRARVVGHATWGAGEAARPSLLLDETAFYPEAGGQMADRGQLAGRAIADVQVDEAGRVHHVLDGDAPLPAVGDEVDGAIDRARRRVHQSLHTGQHMLSRALVDVGRAETVSSRLGETACTIDLDVAALDERRLAEAESLVNAVIDDDVAVRAWFPTESELRGLPLRRAPKVSDNIRVVAVGDFDVSPCGGTHCTRSAQVGFVRIDGVERYKGKLRVTFSAGRRARTQLVETAALVGEVGRALKCGEGEVASSVARLQRDLKEARVALGHARARLAAYAAEELVAAARRANERLVAARFDDGDAEFLRAVGKRLLVEPDLVAVLAAPLETGDAQHVLVARGASSTVDAGKLLRAIAEAAGGRGGGRPESAEGRVPLAVDVPALARRLVDGA